MEMQYEFQLKDDVHLLHVSKSAIRKSQTNRLYVLIDLRGLVSRTLLLHGHYIFYLLESHTIQGHYNCQMPRQGQANDWHVLHVLVGSIIVF